MERPVKFHPNTGLLYGPYHVTNFHVEKIGPFLFSFGWHPQCELVSRSLFIPLTVYTHTWKVIGVCWLAGVRKLVIEFAPVPSTGILFGLLLSARNQ